MVAAVLAAARPAMLERGEMPTYDWRVRLAADPSEASDRIIVVDIGDDDLANVEALMGLTWPWPRELFGYLSDYATKSGANAVLLDWIFQDRGVWGVNDLVGFADTIREDGRTVVGMVTQWRKNEASGATEDKRWLARVAELPDRQAATRAGVRLLAWNARVYWKGDGPVTLYVAGGSSDKALEAWMRLSSIEELAEVFGVEDPDAAPPEPPQPIAAASSGATELTSAAIVRQRFALDVPGAADRSLPDVVNLPPIAIIAAAAPGIGSVSQQNDPDGVVRRHAFFLRKGGKVYPSLPMAGFLLAHPDAAPHFDGDELVVAGRRLPVGDDGRIVLRYHGRRVFRHIPAWDILASVQRQAEGKPPVIPPETFKDHFVIVSASARALRDVTVTPVDERQLGATVNALALDNLLSGEVVRRSGRGTDAVIALLFALLSALAVVGVSLLAPSSFKGFLLTALASALLVGVYLWLCVYLMGGQRLWLALFVPTGGAVVSMIGALLLSATLERKDRRFVQEALGRYTSRELVNELVAHPEKLSLEWGERRRMSVYFSDIAGFTNISEAIEPEQLVALLNDYLTQMTEIVLGSRGVVDKYIGDAVMAFWGAPLDAKDHARRAVLAALEMRARCDEMRPVWKERFGHEVFARAGINTGDAIAGNMGSAHKYNYTVMGDMVNLASRLEGANKAYGTYLMISESTMVEIGDDVVEARELDSLAVKGKNEPVRVFEVLGRKGEVDEGVLACARTFEDGLARYRQRDFAGAIEAFEAALEAHPGDEPAQRFIDRCRHFLDDPPAEDWDGVWRMKEK